MSIVIWWNKCSKLIREGRSLNSFCEHFLCFCFRETKNNLNCKLNGQEKRCNVLSNTEAELAALCRKKAKQLEELEEENHKKCTEVVKTFTAMVSVILKLREFKYWFFTFFFIFSTLPLYLCINNL